MPKKVLITGVTGFAGSFLAEYLDKSTEDILYGTYLTEDSLQNVENDKDRLTSIKINLLDENEVQKLIDSEKPDFIYHLAALTSPSDSFRNPGNTITNNINAQINVLEAVKNSGLFSTRILIVSSADIYGAVSKKDIPIDEDTPLNPTNPYSVSKIAQDYLGLQYFLSYKMPIVRVRPFNHIGPRQSPAFVVASFAKQIAEIEKGQKKPVIGVGNLETKRDFTDVRDMVRAYVSVIKKGKAGDVYNIGSGVSYKISEILEKLLDLSKKTIEVKEDKSLFRPLDIPDRVCNYQKVKKQTGWEPEISIDDTLRSTLDYWREVV